MAKHCVWLLVVAFILGAVFPMPVDFVRSKIGI